MQVEKLRLDSGAFRSQQAAGCAAASHIDDEGVAALVDAFCKRRGSGAGVPPAAARTVLSCARWM